MPGAGTGEPVAVNGLQEALSFSPFGCLSLAALRFVSWEGKSLANGTLIPELYLLSLIAPPSTLWKLLWSFNELTQQALLQTALWNGAFSPC